jgi:hypothetical protein
MDSTAPFARLVRQIRPGFDKFTQYGRDLIIIRCGSHGE